MLTKTEALSLLRDQRYSAMDRLAAQYWGNSVVREAVATTARDAADFTVESGVAFTIAAMVRDSALWPVLASRAETNRAAEAALRRWPDSRGFALFARALEQSAANRLGPPLLDNSLMFFILCGADQGYDYLTSKLGDPFGVPAQAGSIRLGRLALGGSLLSAVEHYGITPRHEWAEYVAACLLAEPIGENDDIMTSDAVRFLHQRRDPRTPIVMERLITSGAVEDEMVVPALTVVPTRDARAAADRLAQWLSIELFRARGERAARLHALSVLVEEAAGVLG
jgi:hypothetical protein